MGLNVYINILKYKESVVIKALFTILITFHFK